MRSSLASGAATTAAARNSATCVRVTSVMGRFRQGERRRATPVDRDDDGLDATDKMSVRRWEARAFPLPIFYGERVRVRGGRVRQRGVFRCPSPRPSPREDGEREALLTKST